MSLRPAGTRISQWTLIRVCAGREHRDLTLGLVVISLLVIISLVIWMDPSILTRFRTPALR